MKTPANNKNIVLISVAASGIGRTIAERYLAQGVSLHVCDASAERISTSYKLASSATLHLKAGDDPARWHRVFWAFALGPIPVALMLMNGNLRPNQVVLLVISLPILVVGVGMSVALVKSLREDLAER